MFSSASSSITFRNPITPYLNPHHHKDSNKFVKSIRTETSERMLEKSQTNLFIKKRLELSLEKKEKLLRGFNKSRAAYIRPPELDRDMMTLR